MKLSLVVTITFLILHASASSAQESHASHDHHEGPSMSLEKPEAGRWETDIHLRKGMEGIRDAVSSFYEGKIEQGDATSLAAALD
ncbi:MAG: hypothetical protein HUJ31_17380, partial [Pseudomonadales bacterium]|nr:hypothetical protein [Pseudomonadales bacterium]